MEGEKNMFITLEKHACFWNIKMTWANWNRPLVWNSSRGWSQLHFLALMPLPCLRAWTGTAAGPQQDSYKNIVSKLRKLARFLQDWIWSGLGTKITDGAISSGKAFYLLPPSLPLFLLSFLLPSFPFWSSTCVEIGGGLAGISSCLLPHGFWGSNSDLQAWQVPLHTEHPTSPEQFS